MDTMVVVDRILDVLALGSGESYCGEAVTHLDHALQTAALAARSGAPDALVAAALLHDIGHVLHALVPGTAGGSVHHEHIGERWLAQYLGKAVTEPIRLHVAAQRYLCALDPEYAASLSAGARECLILEGGAMSPAEVAVFVRLPWALEAVSLRRWDDAAHVARLTVPPPADYRSCIERLAHAGRRHVDGSWR